MKKIFILSLLCLISIIGNAQKFLQANITYQTSETSNDGTVKLFFVGSTEQISFHTIFTPIGNDTIITYTSDTLSGLREGMYFTIAMNAITGDTIGILQYNIFSPNGFLFYQIYSRNIHFLQIHNSTTSTSCNGSVFMEMVTGQLIGNFYLQSESGTVIIPDLNISNLCPGKYTLFMGNSAYADSNMFFRTTFWIDPDVYSPSNMQIDVNTSASLTDTCSGVAHAFISNGNPPYTYYWNGSSVAGTDSITDLCAGIYTLMVVDNNYDSAAVNYFIANESNSYNNPNNTGLPVSDTLYAYIENCSMNFSIPVDSAFIFSCNVIDSNQAVFVWNIWQNDSMTQVSDTVTFTSVNVNFIVLYIYCPTSKSYGNVIQVSDYVQITLTGIPSASVNENGFCLYPNPSSKLIFIESKENNKSEIGIYNLDGKLLFKSLLNSSKILIPTDELLPGVYIVKLSNSRGDFYQKFIKQ